ncbi:hypothetical protein S245_021176, partial [Arachis hypogaea]
NIKLISSGGMAKSNFKQEHDLEKRRAEAARIREKYPDRIPVGPGNGCFFVLKLSRLLLCTSISISLSYGYEYILPMISAFSYFILFYFRV